MFPLINKRETGVNLRRIMDLRGITPKDVQEYPGLGCVQRQTQLLQEQKEKGKCLWRIVQL